jgi:hypothetical protein
MTESTPASHHVVFSRDPETKSVVAEIPVLEIADFGADVPEALERIQAMASFHLKCLLEEGKRLPLRLQPPPQTSSERP